MFMINPKKQEEVQLLEDLKLSAILLVIFCMRKDAVSGPYKTINEAIEAAEPGGMILISQGKYMESLMITLILL